MNMSSHDDGKHNDGKIVELITSHQQLLYGYIVSLLYRSQDAQDVLQETNLILWEKRATAPQESDFGSWACTIAFYQVLSYRKRNQRSRLYFSEDVIKDLAATTVTKPELAASKNRALQHCMEGLPSRSRELLKQRYFTRMSVVDIAGEMERTTKAVSQSLYRIRKQLLDCIQTRLGAMEGGAQ